MPPRMAASAAPCRPPATRTAGRAGSRSRPDTSASGGRANPPAGCLYTCTKAGAGSASSLLGALPGLVRPDYERRRGLMPPRIRTANVESAQWSPNGGQLGQPDLTQPGAAIFGSNVFSPAVQRQRLPRGIYKQLQTTLEKGEPLDPALADAVATAMKDWAMEKGATHYTQGAHPGRARRVVVPDRWHPRDVRGPRLHRLGPELAGVHPREPQRRVPVYPNRLRVVDWRGARSQDPAAALDGRAVEVGAEGRAPVR
jgi:hypothetical protein